MDPFSIWGAYKFKCKKYIENHRRPIIMMFPMAQMVKNPPTMWEDLGLIPDLGRSSGGGHGNPLQYSCLENPHGQRRLAGYSPWGRNAI